MTRLQRHARALRILALTLGLVPALGCYDELDFTKIKCGPTDPCPSGYACGSAGLCVKVNVGPGPGTWLDGGGSDDGPLGIEVSSIIDGGGGEARGIDSTPRDIAGPEIEDAPVDDPLLPPREPDAKRDIAEPDRPLPADTADGPGGSIDGGGEAGPSGPRWSPAKNLLKYGDEGGHPSVAIHPVTGDAVLAWAGNGTYQGRGVYVVRYTASTDTWNAPVAVTEREGIPDVRVAMDGNGRCVVVWSQFWDSDPPVARGIWASFSNDGVSWSASPVLVWDGGSASADSDIGIAMNRSGQARVVWNHHFNPYSYVEPYRVYSAYLQGNTFQLAQLVAECGRYKCEPRVAISGSASGMLLWKKWDDSLTVMSLWAASFAGATLNTPSLVENDDSTGVGVSQVAMNELEQGIAVWSQGGATRSRRFSVKNGWTSAETVGRGSGTREISLGFDAVGTASLGMVGSYGGRSQAGFAYQPAGAPWQFDLVETDNKTLDPYADIEPQVALGPNGSVLLGWRKKLNDTDFAAYARWNVGNAWGSPSQLGIVPDLFATGLRFAVADSGRAIAAWTYYHCNRSDRDSAYVCPTAKDWTTLPPETLEASGGVFVSVYR